MQKEEIEKYLEKISIELKIKGLSNRTIKTYSFFIKKYLESLSCNVEETTKEHIKKFRATLVDKYNKSSRSLALSSLRFFYKDILDMSKVMEDMQNPKKEKTLPVVLTKEEVNSLINSAGSKKSKLIISLLYSSGLRVSELVNLKKGDIEFNQNIGWVRKGKGNKDRKFFISKSLSKGLKEHTEKKSYEEYLFSQNKPLTPRNIQLIIKSAAKKAGINKKVSPHTLRHTFATHLLDSGENLLVIQTLLGHENLETTRIYTHVSSDQIKNVVNPLDRLNEDE